MTEAEIDRKTDDPQETEEERIARELQEINDRAAQIESDQNIDDPKEALRLAEQEIKAEKEGSPVEFCDIEDCDRPITASNKEKGKFCAIHFRQVSEERTTDETWNHPDIAVEDQGKSADEIALERLMANMFEPDEATKWTKCLFYGDIGTSKTVAACDTGGLSVLLVAIENGAKSLRNHPEVIRNVKKVMKVKSVNQVEVLAAQLQKGAFPEFDVIVLDTFSELQKKDLDNMVDEGYAQDSSKARWTPEGKMYQGNTEHMRRIAAQFRDVERHVVFVTHEKEDKDDMSRLFFRPDLTPKVTATLGSYVDIFVRFTAEVDEQGNPKFTGQCRPTRGVTAKTRIGALPTIIDTPTFRLIHEADEKYTAEQKAQVA